MAKGKSGKNAKRGGAKDGARNLHTRVRTAKGRKLSSTRWLQRQLNDPYVRDAKRLGYRSRAAFKLIELDDKFRLLKKGMRIVDLGAAPGGWTQVAIERSGPNCHIVAIDLQEIEPIAGAVLIECDFLADDAVPKLTDALGGKADLVMSDMAAAATGHPQTDHLRIMALLEAAADFAADVLAPGGAFVGKALQGGAENDLLAMLKRDFQTVKHAKPPASRSDSAEMYVIATGFRGSDGQES